MIDNDIFQGDNKKLANSIEALLDLDAKGCLIPHGIGGAARQLLSSALSRLIAANERVDVLEVALGGMLFAFDDGVGLDWSEDLLDFARTLTPAVEFASGRRPIPDGIESLAKQVYQSWESQPGFVPWVEGGNSHKQEEARRIASRTFELALANQVGGGE